MSPSIATQPIVSDVIVLDVLNHRLRPMSTEDLIRNLSRRADATVPITRLRRSLDRLESQGKIVGSGGPKREVLPGWPEADGRVVYWATKALADDIAAEVLEAAVREQDDRLERARLLRRLHAAVAGYEEREALGIISIGRHLADDLDYRAEDGATTWSLDTLRVVVATAERE